VTLREANLEVLRRWNDTYLEQGAEAALGIVPEVFTEDADFSPLLAREVEGRSYQGHDGIRTFFRDLDETLGGVHYEASEYHPVSEEVIVLVTRMTGNPRGTTPISQDLALVYEFEGGRVRRLTAYGSLNEALEAARQVANA
jgi:ketosteroid isomerase-like protein